MELKKILVGIDGLKAKGSLDIEINNIDSNINTSINNELYPQRVVRIKPPKVESKKRPPEKMKVKKGEFVF